MSVNKVILVGRVGADPELKNLDGGGKVVNFSMATSERFTAKDGTKKENTEWHKIVAWGTLADIIAKNVVKGQELFVEGKIQTRSWEDKDGTKKYTTEIVALDVKFLGSKKDNGNGGENNTQTGAPAQNASSNTGKGKSSQPAAVVTGNNDSEDDLPF